MLTFQLSSLPATAVPAAMFTGSISFLLLTTTDPAFNGGNRLDSKPKFPPRDLLIPQGWSRVSRWLWTVLRKSELRGDVQYGRTCSSQYMSGFLRIINFVKYFASQLSLLLSNFMFCISSFWIEVSHKYPPALWLVTPDAMKLDTVETG